MFEYLRRPGLSRSFIFIYVFAAVRFFHTTYDLAEDTYGLTEQKSHFTQHRKASSSRPEDALETPSSSDNVSETKSSLRVRTEEKYLEAPEKFVRNDPSEPGAVETTNTSSPYAYAYVLGSIHENRSSYKGFLYDILISVHMLRKFGSKADVWLMTQLSPDSSLAGLPAEDMRLLKALNIHVNQLKKPKSESFAQIMFEKLRILQMTQYRRVIYLDSDTIPLNNLDYLFHLSDNDGQSSSPPVLKPNLILASGGEPCNGGLFMLEPQQGAWEEVQNIVERQRKAGRKLPYPHFDKLEGFGHNFMEAGDKWQGIRKEGRRWNFHGAHADQGLLYYYTKYVLQNVSIVLGEHHQTWGSAGEGSNRVPTMINETIHELKKYSQNPAAIQFRCDDRKNLEYAAVCTPPYRDFAHFTGDKKPWQRGKKSPYFRRKDTSSFRQPYKLWFKELSEINDKYGMGLDVEQWDDVHLQDMKESPLGYIPQFRDHEQLVHNTSQVAAPIMQIR